MYFSKLTLSAVTLLGFAQTLFAAPTVTEGSTNKCRNSITTFKDGISDWTEQNDGKNWSITDEGLEVFLQPPIEFIRANDASDSGNPYNVYASPESPTFIGAYRMQYGKVTYRLKTSNRPGAVTGAYFMEFAKSGDEIDFEMLGAETTRVQSNFFYGKNIIYGVNGKDDSTGGVDLSDGFHDYTIDWSPDRIQWLVDSKVIRETKKTDTCVDDECIYPTNPT
ncbi:glycosyl hydrolases family 16-domain-containing protein [Pilaira anomala]|nr:glycosyl hydrolases family 16-domain-containing protein [Pilaira anomala]